MKRRLFRNLTAWMITAVMTMSLVTPVFADNILIDATSEDNVITEDFVSTDISSDTNGAILSDDLMNANIITDTDVQTNDTLTKSTDDIIVPEDKIDTSVKIEDFKGFYTEEMAERARYINSIDPGTIWMPMDPEDYFRKETSRRSSDDEDYSPEITNDKVSQTQVGCSWPETQLTFEERTYVRNRVEDIVAELITDDMSDIEKYWTLANWVYTNIEYKNVPEKVFDHDTSHGSYCALKYGYAVCQGYTLLYSHLCHAADLPCDEVSLEKHGANHLINVIPNINGHAYYVDSTNNMFLFSDNAYSPWDVPFRELLADDPKVILSCDNDAFLQNGDNKYPVSITTSQYTTYDGFYHGLMARDSSYDYLGFGAPYVEKGSGTRGVHVAHYNDFALQEELNTGNWKYDDFSNNPRDLKAYEETNCTTPEKKTLININDVTLSGVKDLYDCNSDEAYLAALRNDIKLTNNNKELKLDTDYFINYIRVDRITGYVKISGWGDYTGYRNVDFNKVEVSSGGGSTPTPTPDPDPTPGPAPEPEPEPEPTPEPGKTEETINISIQTGAVYNLTENYGISNFTTQYFNSTAIQVGTYSNYNELSYLGIKGLCPCSATVTIETDNKIYTINADVRSDIATEITKEINYNEQIYVEDIISSYNGYGVSVLDDDIVEVKPADKNKDRYRLPIYGKKPGETTVYVTNNDTTTAINVKVKKEEATIDVSVTKDAIYNLCDDITENHYVSYSTDNVYIAFTDLYADNNCSQHLGIKGIQTGSTTSVVETEEKIYNININVTPTIDKEINEELEVGQCVYIKDVVNSYNGYGFSIINTDIAYSGATRNVSGKYEFPIYGANVGQTIAYVTVGKTTTAINITVKEKGQEVPTPEPAYKTSDITVVVGGKITIPNYAKLPTDGKNYNITYSNKNIATISDKGVVQGKTVGTTTATITRSSGTTIASITVKNPTFKEKNFVKNTTEDFNVGFDEENLDVTYTSNKPDIASVDSKGNVTVKTKGQATITAQTQNKKYTVNVIIYDPAISGNKDVYLDGKTVALKITDGNGKTQWSSSNTDIATVDKNGMVKGVAEGKATITAINNNRTMTYDIGVYRIPRFLQKDYVINDGNVVENIFDDAYIEGTTYSSTDPSVVSVDNNGTITGHKKGSARITAFCGSKKYTTNVKVFAPDLIGPNSILLDKKTVTLKVVNGNGKTQWSSSDDSVITVDKNGRIKAVSKGTATITAVNNNRTMSLSIRTFNVPKFAEKTYITNIDTLIDLSIIKDDDMLDVTYSVKDTRVAVINQNGVVIPIKTGSVGVIAKANGVTYNTTLKIYAPSINGKDVVKTGKTLGLSIKGGNGPTQWTSSDTSKATIDAKGKVTGISKGKVIITAINTGKILTKEITVE